MTTTWMVASIALTVAGFGVPIPQITVRADALTRLALAARRERRGRDAR